MIHSFRAWALVLIFAAQLFHSGISAESGQWLSLFDGHTLGSWRSTRFGGEGEVQVRDGQILLGYGNNLTGITWAEHFPYVEYEVELQAMRVDGFDFFCGLTLPVGESHASLIVGGWGGTVVGISSIDEKDASENETTLYRSFESGRWYTVRVRVERVRLQAWIDEERVIDLPLAGRRLSIRPEVYASLPFGIATWRTAAALRDLRIRSLKDR